MMRQPSIFAAAVAMAMSVAAQTPGYIPINNPTSYEYIPACTTYTIKWTPPTDPKFMGPVMFQLIGGSTITTQQFIGGKFGYVDSSLGSHQWEVPCNAGEQAVYGLEIILDRDNSIFQYSMPFHIMPAVAVAPVQSSALGGTTAASVAPTSTIMSSAATETVASPPTSTSALTAPTSSESIELSLSSSLSLSPSKSVNDLTGSISTTTTALSPPYVVGSATGVPAPPVPSDAFPVTAGGGRIGLGSAAGVVGVGFIFVM